MNREKLLTALEKFASQRPGLDSREYGDSFSAYRSEARAITRDLNDARVLLRAIRWRESISAESIIDMASRAFSGRLSIEPLPNDGLRIDYCVGQFFPTEFRKAVCAVLVSVLWQYWREECGADSLAKIQKMARAELSPAIARRWFR